jgi:hypothetical protein
LSSKSVNIARIRKYTTPKEIFLDGLYTPPADSSKIYLVNRTVQCVSSSSHPEFKFQIASEHEIANADLYYRRIGWRGFARLPLKHVAGFDYVAVDTNTAINLGRIEYCVAVEAGNKTITFPGEIPNKPGVWDFSISNLWNMTIVGPRQQFVLLDVSRDRNDFVFPHYTRALRYLLDYPSGSNSTEVALSPTVTFSNEAEIPFGVQLSISGILAPLRDQLSEYHHVVLKARSDQDSLCTLGIIFLMSNGKSYGANVDLPPEWKEIEIPLSAFQRRNALILPNSYPLFLPKIWKSGEDGSNGNLDLRSLQSIQIVVDPPPAGKSDQKREIRFELVSVTLEK